MFPLTIISILFYKQCQLLYSQRSFNPVGFYFHALTLRWRIVQILDPLKINRGLARHQFSVFYICAELPTVLSSQLIIRSKQRVPQTHHLDTKQGCIKCELKFKLIPPSPEEIQIVHDVEQYWVCGILLSKLDASGSLVTKTELDSASMFFLHTPMRN